MTIRLDLTNQRFGRLIAIAPGPAKSKSWRCRCDCGTVRDFRMTHLRSGHTKSCGCLHRELFAQLKTRHGDCKRRSPTSSEYYSWLAMKSRCGNPKTDKYHYYGGRGISVCERWRNDFTAFLADMGRKPSSRHSIDRINNDGNYEPGNCRWATTGEQKLNCRKRGTAS